MSLRERDEGFTLVELMITMAIMGIVATAVTAVAMATFTSTGTITNRRDVFGDGRIALDRLSKQLRQGVTVDPTSDDSTLTFSGYDGGSTTPVTIVWRATGAAAPYTLEVSINGGSFYTLLRSLTSKSVFTYTPSPAGSATDEVAVALSLGTTTASTVISTVVNLRNVQT
jgi:prepilin-type N-terminal cleavage/methylation domain-containing protein